MIQTPTAYKIILIWIIARPIDPLLDADDKARRCVRQSCEGQVDTDNDYYADNVDNCPAT